MKLPVILQPLQTGRIPAIIGTGDLMAYMICLQNAGCGALILYMTVNQAATSDYNHYNYTAVAVLYIKCTLNNQKA